MKCCCSIFLRNFLNFYCGVCLFHQLWKNCSSLSIYFLFPMQKVTNLLRKCWIESFQVFITSLVINLYWRMIRKISIKWPKILTLVFRRINWLTLIAHKWIFFACWFLRMLEQSRKSDCSPVFRLLFCFESPNHRIKWASRRRRLKANSFL